MKTLIYLTTLLPLVLFGQNKSLEVVYSEYVSWELKNPEKYSKEEKDALAKAMNEKQLFRLTLNSEKSLYQSIPKINNNEPSGGISMSFNSSNTYIYKDIKNNIYMSEETYPKKFVIKDSLYHVKWQILDETKEILGYKTRKAITSINNFDCVAWYTPDINIANGPDEFWGLPGLIIYVETKHKKNNEIKIIKAENISVAKDDTILEEFSKKEKGKTVTKEEFQKIFDEFVKKEDEMYGGGVDKD